MLFTYDNFEVETPRLQVKLSLEAVYIEGEPAAFYPDGSACPPSGSYAVLDKVFIEGIYNADGADVYHEIRGPGWRDFACECVDLYVTERESEIEEFLTDTARERFE